MEEEATTLGGQHFWGGAFGFFRNNPEGHELRVRTGPLQRRSFCLKKTIDDERVSFGSGSTAAPGGATINNVGTGVDGHAG